jgi:hypothetical protein
VRERWDLLFSELKQWQAFGQEIKQKDLKRNLQLDEAGK